MVASSSSVYGATPTLPKREDLPTRPMSPYAASKLAAEAYTNAYAHSFGLPTLALRLFNVFGPRQPAGHAYAAVVPVFVDAALAGRPLTVDGDGTQTRDFTFVDTVATVIADAVVRRVTDPEPVNLAFGTRTDLLTLIELLERVSATRSNASTVRRGRATCRTPRPTAPASARCSRTSCRFRWRTVWPRRSRGCATSDERDAAPFGRPRVGVHHPPHDVALVELTLSLGPCRRAHRRPPLAEMPPAR